MTAGFKTRSTLGTQTGPRVIGGANNTVIVMPAIPQVSIEELEEAEFGTCGIEDNGTKNGKAKEAQEEEGPEQISLGEMEQE